jgi:hypothetical protein
VQRLQVQHDEAAGGHLVLAEGSSASALRVTIGTMLKIRSASFEAGAGVLEALERLVVGHRVADEGLVGGGAQAGPGTAGWRVRVCSVQVSIALEVS